MPVYKACEGKLQSETAPNVFSDIGEVTGWNVDESANIKSYFKLGDCNEQNVAGGVSRTLGFEGNYDPADVGQAPIAVGDTVKVRLLPIGTDAGDPRETYTGVVESFNRTGQGDDFVTFQASIKVSGAPVIDVVP